MNIFVTETNLGFCFWTFWAALFTVATVSGGYNIIFNCTHVQSVLHFCMSFLKNDLPTAGLYPSSFSNYCFVDLTCSSLPVEVEHRVNSEALFIKNSLRCFSGSACSSFVHCSGLSLPNEYVWMYKSVRLYVQLLSAVLIALCGTAHKAVLLMNPSMTRGCDVVKANPNMEALFEYFIHIESSSFNQEAPARSCNSAKTEISSVFTSV